MTKHYPIIKDVNFVPLGVLQNVYNYFITKEINLDYSFQFDLLLEDPKVKYITDQNYVEIKGQLYSIDYYQVRRTQNNEKFIHVEGSHVFYGLINQYWEQDGELDNYKPNALMTDILEDLTLPTPYYFVGSEITTRNDVMLERGNILKNITKVMNIYGGELQLDNFNFSVMNQLGTNRGSQVRYKKNMKEIIKTVDARVVITRLYVYGKDGLTIETVNAGKKYIDSQYKNKYSYTRTGEVVYNDIEDPTKLLELGNEFLAKNEVPSVSYQVALTDLFKLTGENEMDYGDTVHVIDDELGIKLQSRVLKFIEYLLPEESHQSSIVLGNFIKTMVDFYKKYEQSTQIVNKVFDRSTKNLSTSFLEGRINTLKNQLLASGAYASAQVLDDQGFLLENTNAASQDYGAMYLGPGIFAIADSKLSGEWNWRTFGTGSGFIADEIVTGTLKSLNIDNGNGNFTVDAAGNMVANSGLFRGKVDVNNGWNQLTIDPSSGTIFSVVNGGSEMLRINTSGHIQSREYDFITNSLASINCNLGTLRIKQGSNYIDVQGYTTNPSDQDIVLNSFNGIQMASGNGIAKLDGNQIATEYYAVEDYSRQGIQLRVNLGKLEFSLGGAWTVLVNA